MPSPFPGMDPYLENPLRWRGVHTLLIAGLVAVLNRRLPPGFVARAEERCYVQPWEHTIFPDAVTLLTSSDAKSGRGGSGGGGTVAVLEPATMTLPLTFRKSPEAQREGFVEIISVDKDEPAVCVLELLSPTNKTPGKGHDEYRANQRSVLRSDITRRDNETTGTELQAIIACRRLSSKSGLKRLIRALG